MQRADDTRQHRLGARPVGIRRPGLAVAAALMGALAGIAQAIGLFSRVFAVPAIAALHADPATEPATRASLETAFTLLNGWGGVAICEHLGQILTLAWMTLAALQALSNTQRFAKAAAICAAVAMAGIGLGLGEGLAIALGHDAPLLAMSTVAGHLAFPLWSPPARGFSRTLSFRRARPYRPRLNQREIVRCKALPTST